MSVFQNAIEKAFGAGKSEEAILKTAGRALSQGMHYRLTALVPASDGPARLRVALSGFDDIVSILQKLHVNFNPGLTFGYQKVDALREVVEHGRGGIYQDPVLFAGVSLENKPILKTMLKTALRGFGIDKVLIVPLPLPNGTGVVGLSGGDIRIDLKPELEKFACCLGEILGGGKTAPSP